MEVKHLRIGLVGFLVAMTGALLGFSGFAIEQRWLAIVGFLITVSGVIIGMVGIVYVWVTVGRRVITESAQSAKELSKRLRNDSEQSETNQNEK